MDGQLSEEIVSIIRQHDGPIQTFFLKKGIKTPFDAESFKETLNQLLEEGIVVYTNQGLQMKTKTLQQLIDESDNIVKLYFQGITLSDIASKENKKVIEIRDHILGYLNEPVTEDRYKDDFEKYKMNVRQFTSLYGETKVTYRYLAIKYQNGKEELGGMLDDSSKTFTFKEQVNQITKKSIEIDGEVIPVDPVNLITYLLKIRGECVDSKILIDEYDKFLDRRHLKSVQSLAISIGTLNSISGKENNNILQDKNGLIKYYRFEKKEVLEFIDMIDLNQYANKYISSALIFKNYPELMKQYDVDNEYQLYNLLYKYNAHLGKYKMHFVRIPSIAFGKGDDFKQVERLLELSGKTTTEEFYRKYEEM